MKPFTTIESKIVPLNVPNVDTDQIIPKQFLKRIERTGFGQFLFYDWRFLENGQPNPDFVINKPEYQGAKILLAQDNFGCGSSREHAPWALLDYGFQVIIAPSFADIFYNNCFQNGILPIVLGSDKVNSLFAAAQQNPSLQFVVNLQEQTIAAADGSLQIAFEIKPDLREKLLKGLDDIGWTLQFADQISEYEKTRVFA